MFAPRGESKAVVAPENKSLLSNFDLLWVSRYLVAPQNENNMAIQEATLTYNFNDHWSFGIKAEFDQMIAAENANKTDFQDTDLRLTYKYIPNTKRVDIDFGVTLLGSLPTSKNSQNQIEYFGTGLGTFFDLSYRKFSLSLYSKYYEYFYEDHFIKAVDTSTKDEPDESQGLIDEVSTTRYKLVPNCSSYNDNSVAVIYNPFAGFKLRNEVRLESVGYFDEHFSNTLHDRYGFGYTFSPLLSIWFSVDSAKNTNLGGDLFDSKNSVDVLSFYFKI